MVFYGAAMKLIGLTGGIGSGKSSVSARLVERGAVLIDADAIVREVQTPGHAVFDAMVERFGAGIVHADGNLDRQGVADLVFSNELALADLNAIVHPAVSTEIAARLAIEVDTDHIVVLDVPLLVESGRDDLTALLVVDVDPELAMDRLVEHRGFREDDVRARMARQVSREERVARAGRVIDNSGTLEDLERAVDEVWDWIGSLPHA